MAARGENEKNAAQLTDCVKVQFLRLLQEGGNCTLSEDAMIAAAWPETKHQANSQRFSRLMRKVVQIQEE